MEETTKAKLRAAVEWADGIYKGKSAICYYLIFLIESLQKKTENGARKLTYGPKNPPPSLDQNTIIFQEKPVASIENKTRATLANGLKKLMRRKQLLSISAISSPLESGGKACIFVYILIMALFYFITVKFTEPGHQVQLANSVF